MQRSICTIFISAILSITLLSLRAQENPEHSLAVEDINQIGSDTDSTTINTMEWSPDGNLLAIGGSDGIILFDEEFTLVDNFSGSIGEVFSISWSSDNHRLAALSQEEIVDFPYYLGHEFILDIDTGEMVELSGDGGPVTPIEWSPEGQYIAVGRWERKVTVYDSETGQLIFLFSLEERDGESLTNMPRSFCWSADDELLLIQFMFDLYILEIPSGGIERHFPGGYRDQSDCTTDLTLLVTADGAIRNLLTDEIIMVEEHYMDAVAVAWSPDDRFFAINRGNYQVQIWEWDGNAHLVAEMEGGIYGDEPPMMFYYDDSIAWHPDGELLAAVGEDNIVRIWRVIEG